MKSSLLFSFSVDKENNTIYVKRAFNAGLQLVWDAWTKAEILDQWWAPKPYRAETKSLDFRVGGTWLYAMVSPENEKHWAKADYTAIQPNQSIYWVDAFCDENGVESPGKPRSVWENQFTEDTGITTVSITLKHDSLADLELMIEMGFKEGFTMGLQNLEDLLNQSRK
ncbi:MAG: SRPBCC domain-containing protein [Crocinitomicaceae bacterium]|nr:SRPBCC domain-containing protein [Crocinitomicaceae bacterium]